MSFCVDFRNVLHEPFWLLTTSHLSQHELDAKIPLAAHGSVQLFLSLIYMQISYFLPVMHYTFQDVVQIPNKRMGREEFLSIEIQTDPGHLEDINPYT